MSGLAFLALAPGSLFLPGPIPAQTTVIQADRVFTGTPEGVVGPRFIALRDGRISSVNAELPPGLPASVELVHAAFAAPGLIDARTTLGLSGLHPADDDRDETSGPNQAHVRAIDAFDPDDSMVAYALRGGVTTIQSGPGDANSIGGQAAIFKLGTRTVGEATVRAPSAVVFSLDESAKLTYGQANRYPSTRMANVGLIRQALLDADRYRTESQGEKPPARDLKKEALTLVLDQEIPALVSAERADELATALRLAEEFGLDLRIVGATEAGTVLDRLAEAGVPLLLGPPGEAALGVGKGEGLLETAARLEERGIPFALVTGDDEDAARWSLMDWARAAVRGGLSPEDALEAITISPARILGLDRELGSIQTGKAADLVLFDGDPMEATTRVQAVYVAGKAVYVREP
jgi:imidazolonepropionase-like amidohydrolase